MSYEPFFPSKIWYLFLICPFFFFTSFHSKSKTILHHKVTGQCFIFNLDNMNEWIRLLLSLRKFDITWPPSLFLMLLWGFSHNLIKLPLYFQNKNFLFFWALFVRCIWHCCRTPSANYSASIYLLIDIKKNSDGRHPTKCTQITLPV